MADNYFNIGTDSSQYQIPLPLEQGTDVSNLQVSTKKKQLKNY